MPGPPKKPASVRQRGNRTASLTLIGGSEIAKEPPKPPSGLLKESVELWETYWASMVAKAAIEVDIGGLRRWIINLDEWNRAMKAMRKKRLVLGSMGQPTLNPLAGYIASREAAIKEAEDKYGLTPMARLKLGIAYGQAQMTADELNRTLDESDEPDTDDDTWRGEWAEA